MSQRVLRKIQLGKIWRRGSANAVYKPTQVPGHPDCALCDTDTKKPDKGFEN